MNFDFDSLLSLSPWSWVILGVILCAAEVFAPGAFLIWIGLAAIATGAVIFVLPLAAPWALILFAGLSLAFALIGYRIYGVISKTEPEALLNQGAQEFIGKAFVLAEPIVQGAGRIITGDTVWRVSGPDMPAGQSVRVVSVERGTLLRVEAA